jgi:hypothetical protein
LATAGAAIALVAFIAPSLRVAAGRKQALIEFDRSIHSSWSAIPYERAIVLWPDDAYYRLKEYQAFRGEKPGLEVYNTASLFHERPRMLFRRKHGFDAQGAIDEAHRIQPIKPEFIIGQQRSDVDAHAFAVVHEYIAQMADVPVVAFDPPRPPRVLAPPPTKRALP